MPTIFLGVVLLINLFVRVSPQKFSMPNSLSSLSNVLVSVGLLFLGIHIGMLESHKGQTEFLTWFNYGLIAFLIIGGNVFGKLEQNFFVGFRLPWTLASTNNWKKTHRFGGMMMVCFGFALLISTFFIKDMLISVCAIIIPLLLPLFYSFAYFQKHERSAEL